METYPNFCHMQENLIHLSNQFLILAHHTHFAIKILHYLFQLQQQRFSSTAILITQLSITYHMSITLSFWCSKSPNEIVNSARKLVFSSNGLAKELDRQEPLLLTLQETRIKLTLVWRIISKHVDRACLGKNAFLREDWVRNFSEVKKAHALLFFIIRALV